MKEERITIEIDAEGRITADAEGFSGDACLRALDQLLEALGSGEPRVERKPDARTAGRTTRRNQTVGKKP